MRIFEKRAKRIIELSFNHGIYFDFWSVGHIFSGLMIGLVLLFFNFSILDALFISFVLAVLYEVFEIMIKVQEDVQNIILDIILVVLGTYLSFVYFIDLSNSEKSFVFIIVSLLNLGLNLIGWKVILNKKRRLNRRKGEN